MKYMGRWVSSRGTPSSAPRLTMSASETPSNQEVTWPASSFHKEAVTWYRKAAGQNHPQAQYNLGWMYEQGRGVEKNEKEAVRWYLKAAEQNIPQAQYRLGAMYARGLGVKKNEKEEKKHEQEQEQQSLIVGGKE